MRGCLGTWFMGSNVWGADDRDGKPGDVVRVQAGAECSKVLMVRGRERRRVRGRERRRERRREWEKRRPLDWTLGTFAYIQAHTRSHTFM